MYLLVSFLLLQAPAGGTNNMLHFMMIGGMLLIFYFFFIKPSLDRAKKQKGFMEDLKKGDKIVTIGGIHGKITKISEGTLVIEVDSGTKLRIETSAISMEYTSNLAEATAKKNKPTVIEKASE